MRNNKSNVEIQGFFRRCTDAYPYAACLCAMAVRYGSHVIVVDKCGAQIGEPNDIHPMTIQAFLNGDLEENFKIIRMKRDTIKVSTINISFKKVASMLEFLKCLKCFYKLEDLYSIR